MLSRWELRRQQYNHRNATPDMNLTVIQSQRQDVWTDRAVINFTFGASGAALYLLSTCAAVLEVNSASAILRLVSIALVAFGLLAVAAEAGRPIRARYLLTNLRRSWMSRESLAAVAFLMTSFLSLLVQSRFLVACGCIAAIA